MKPYKAERSAEICVRKDTPKITAVLATETPVHRHSYMEVLRINSDSIDLGRFPIPILVSHNDDKLPVGIALNPRIVNRELIADLRLSESEEGQGLLRDVRAGILTNISIGYRPLDYFDEGDTRYITSFEVLEASIVAVPADPKARVKEIRHERLKTMQTNDIGRADAAEMLAIAKHWNKVEMAQDAITRGHTLAQFRETLLDSIKDGPLLQANTEIGMTDREADSFSIVRAINAKLSGDWRDAGLEREVMETTRGSARHADSIVLPPEVMRRYSKRDITLGSPANGSNLVQTDVLGGSFIDALLTESVILERCTRLAGLQGDVAIPKTTSAVSAAFVTETGTISESTPTFSQVTMSPNTIASFVEISRRTLMQSTPDIEAILRRDMSRQIAAKIDDVIIEGGGSNEPSGVLQTSGIASVALGTNGDAITYAALVDMVKEVEIDNANSGALAFVTNPKVAADMRITAKQSSGVEGNFILADNSRVLGYPVIVTNNCPSDLTKGTGTALSAVIYGDWSSVLVGFYNSVEILVDQYTKAEQNLVRIRAVQDLDVAVRHAESFAAITDVVAN